MNALDVILVIVLSWSAYRGWQTGLVRATLGLAGLVLAYVTALAYGQSVGESLLGDGSTLNGILGIILVFFGVAVLSHVAAGFARAFLHATPFGIFDAAAGALLGLAQGVLAFGLLIVLAYSYPLHSRIPAQIDDSRLAGAVQSGALALVDGIKAVLPGVRKALDDLNIRGSDDPPPVVETLRSGADDATRKLDGVVEESRKRIESGTDEARKKLESVVKESKKRLEDVK